MAKTLDELVAELTGEIPAMGGVPSAAQYERAIKDAALDFSRRAGTEKITSLAVVSGTATYDLPADFLSLISLDSIYNPSGVLNTPDGLIPLSATFCEEITFRNGQLTINPIPTYTLTRQMNYKAGWALTGQTPTYEDMGDEEAAIILLKAQALAQVKKNNARSGSAYRYTIGGVTVDTTSQASASDKDVDQLESEYEKRVDKYVGHAFLMG